MNKKIATLIAGILLVGIVTAGLVPWLSNIVTGSVTVEGPVFYLDGQIADGVYHKLLVNEIPKKQIEINWSDGERIVFKTEPLNINEFYKANFEIHIWAKVNDSENNNELIQLNVVKINESGIEEEICGPMSVNLSKYYNQFREREIFCSSNDEISMNPKDKFGLRIQGTSENETVKYWISTGKGYGPDEDRYSRIEVSAA